MLREQEMMDNRRWESVCGAHRSGQSLSVPVRGCCIAWIAGHGSAREWDAIRLHSDRALETTRVKPRAVLSRRRLLATAIGGGAAWLIGGVSFLVSYRGRVGSMSGSSTFAAFLVDLGYSRTIGEACLKALPAVEASKGCLTRAIFGDVRDADTRALVQAIRERSRADFRDGRIVTVDGWMLSLTETRVYALAALLASAGEKA
jgi:hypothetical protein